MITEASRKANKLFVMHSAKQIGKIKDAEERERQAKDLEMKAKKMGLDRADIEQILDDQGAWGDEYKMKKTAEEAQNMHKYVNTLSLERSVNLWAEAAKTAKTKEEKEGEDPEPVSGRKTITNKNQEKIVINPIEKQPQNKSA